MKQTIWDNPLVKQTLDTLKNRAMDYFTKPAVQSPIASTQFPTPFEEAVGQKPTMNFAPPVHQAVFASPTQAPTSTPTPTPTDKSFKQLVDNIRQGFNKYGAKEAASYAEHFANAGKDLPDPYMPAVLAIKETSAGKKLAHKNNWLNIGPSIDYPDVPTNLVGGQGHRGFKGVIHSGLYDDYLKSGNLEHFFNKYTPPTDNQGKQINDPMSKQIKDYQTYRKYFTDS